MACRRDRAYAGAIRRALFADALRRPDHSSTATFSICLIENALLRYAQSLDVTEAIVVETVSLDELAAMLRDGRFSAGPHVAAGYILLDQLQWWESTRVPMP